MKNIYVSGRLQSSVGKEVEEGVDDAAIEQFGENVKNLMRQEFGEQKKDNRTRMSNIGREIATCGTC